MDYRQAINIDGLACHRTAGACRASCSTTWTAAPRTSAPSPRTARPSRACASGRGRWWTSAGATSSAQLLGAASAMPAVVGPTGLNGLSWRDGDLELARAATAAGLPFVMSTVSMSLVEDVAREAPGRLWLQAYVFCGAAHHRGDHAARARGRLRVRDADQRLPGRRQARARPAHAACCRSSGSRSRPGSTC